MLKRNLTKFLVGTKLCSRRPPEPEMTIVVRGAFALRPGAPMDPLEDQGKLTAEVCREGDDERTGEVLCPSDFADFKLHAEALLCGTCHAPNGAAIPECPVRFSVGSWSKTLRVVGTRAWSDDHTGAVMSKPLPFTKMPLDWAHAFGGPGYAKNPSGKGHRTRELPNVEHPGHYVRAHGDTPEPSGFGPINATWPQRASKVGKEYGKGWRKKRAPFFAEDFDWTHFNASAPDQWMKGYLRGDEDVELVNLHPEAPSFSAKLPGLRVRVFLHDADGTYREVPMVLDTLFAEPDRGSVKLTWRGVAPVKEDDFADVKSMLVASEPLASAPLPADHYHAKLAELEDDPSGIRAKLEAHLPPEDAKAIVEKYERMKKGEPDPEVDTEGLDPISALMKKKLGRLREADRAELRATIQTLKEKVPGVDVEAKMAEAAQRELDAPPVAIPIKPGVLPDVRLRERMREILATVAGMKKRAAETKAELPTDKLAELEKLPHDPRLVQLDPKYTPPGPLSTDEPGPGADLSDRDFTGADLSKRDLSGANLSNAVLTRANLRGANLTGAKLERAILFKTDLTGATLAKADLTQVNAARAVLRDADLSEANLEIGFFEQADLSGATLEGASGEYVVFKSAKLSGVKAKGARLDKSDFGEATLEKADFADASVIACQFEKARARGLRLERASIRNARFESADLTGAVLARARGTKCLFVKTRLDGADFTLAAVERSHFNEASAIGARFHGANLRECRFRHAKLEGAEIVRANLFQADLAKAKLDRAKFTESNLFESCFAGASGAGCDFTGANLKLSTLEDA